MDFGGRSRLSGPFTYSENDSGNVLLHCCCHWWVDSMSIGIKTADLSLSVLIQIRWQICAWRRGRASLNKYYEISHRFWQLVKINKTLISFLFTRLKVKVNFIIPKWQLASQPAVYENKKELHTDTHTKKTRCKDKGYMRPREVGTKEFLRLFVLHLGSANRHPDGGGLYSA